MKQPTVGEPNEATKTCWGCEAKTPYNQGFCEECWEMLSADEQEVYYIAHDSDFSSEIAASVRLGTSNYIKRLRRPIRQTYSPDFLEESSLPDLDLGFGEL